MTAAVMAPGDLDKGHRTEGVPLNVGNAPKDVGMTSLTEAAYGSWHASTSPPSQACWSRLRARVRSSATPKPFWYMTAR